MRLSDDFDDNSIKSKHVSMSDKRRIVVTGIGGICNLGPDRRTIWTEMVEGRPNMQSMDTFAGDQWAVKFGAPVTGWDGTDRIPRQQSKRMDRFTVLGLYAAMEAIEDSGINFEDEDPHNCGVVIGSGVGGVESIETSIYKMAAKGPHRVPPFLVPRLMVNACAGNVSIQFGLKGPNSAPATACASAGNAIGDAFQLIQDGDADVMVTGGAEASLVPIAMAGFMTMRALSTRNDSPNTASRPFDRDRDGFVMGEGAGIFLIEELEHARKRGAHIYCEILGFGSSGDASHLTAPHADGAGAAHAMKMALADAGLNADQVDYINAHGTSTPLGDSAEVAAIKTVFGNHALKLTVSSTKSVTGHTLGASGGLEGLATALAIQHQVCPPTANLDNPDDPDIDFAPHTAHEREIRYALSNSFGFGGHNVSLAFGQFKD